MSQTRGRFPALSGPARGLSKLGKLLYKGAKRAARSASALTRRLQRPRKLPRHDFSPRPLHQQSLDGIFAPDRSAEGPPSNPSCAPNAPRPQVAQAEVQPFLSRLEAEPFTYAAPGGRPSVPQWVLEHLALINSVPAAQHHGLASFRLYLPYRSRTSSLA